MKDFFNSPQIKEEFEKLMKEPNPFMGSLPNGDNGFGAYSPAPVFYKSFVDSET